MAFDPCNATEGEKEAVIWALESVNREHLQLTTGKWFQSDGQWGRRPDDGAIRRYLAEIRKAIRLRIKQWKAKPEDQKLVIGTKEYQPGESMMAEPHSPDYLERSY